MLDGCYIAVVSMDKELLYGLEKQNSDPRGSNGCVTKVSIIGSPGIFRKEMMALEKERP